MICDCKNTIEARLLERFKSLQPGAAEHKVELKGYSIVVTDAGLELVASMPIEATADVTPKRGGEPKRKAFNETMMANFCPFCGKPARGPKPEGAEVPA